MMKYLAVAVAFLLAAANAKGDEPLSPFNDGFTSTYSIAREFDRLTAVLGDEVLRDLICRLSYERYGPRNLSSALGIPEGQVMRRIDTLRGWGLVRVVGSDAVNPIVEPLPGTGEQTLRRWAIRYCPQGEACKTSNDRSGVNAAWHNGRGKVRLKDTVDAGHKKVAYWLLKSEPGKYSWNDLVRDKQTYWDGVRNYQASNNLKAMKMGDRAFFYHSVDAREIIGVVEIVKPFYPDPTDSTGRFGMVDVIPVGRMAKPVNLSAIKADPRLADMALVRQSRLSVMPVSTTHWHIIHDMATGGTVSRDGPLVKKR